MYVQELAVRITYVGFRTIGIHINDIDQFPTKVESSEEAGEAEEAAPEEEAAHQEAVPQEEAQPDNKEPPLKKSKVSPQK